jgi:hypothetical protein
VYRVERLFEKEGIKTFWARQFFRQRETFHVPTRSVSMVPDPKTCVSEQRNHHTLSGSVNGSGSKNVCVGTEKSPHIARQCQWSRIRKFLCRNREITTHCPALSMDPDPKIFVSEQRNHHTLSGSVNGSGSENVCVGTEKSPHIVRQCQ